jgi:tripartite-type tricarboxylate transporter receptor subunit TctC
MKFIQSAIVSCVGLAVSMAAHANDGKQWPVKSINLVIGFSAGGPTDTAARIVARELSKDLGQPVVVDNRPGASGAVAEKYFVNQAADGYSLMMLVVPTVFKRIFDKEQLAINEQIDPVARVYSHHNVLAVNPNYPGMRDVSSTRDLVEVVKKTQKSLSFTSAGSGSIGHLAGQQMAYMAKIDLQHISYKGAAPALNDTLSGHIPMIFGDYTTLLQHIETGKIRPIAVASSVRLPKLENVSTLMEQGFSGLTAVPWGGVVVKTGTDETIKNKIQDSLKKILSDKDVQTKISNAGLLVNFAPANIWKEQINNDFKYWKNVVDTNGINAE